MLPHYVKKRDSLVFIVDPSNHFDSLLKFLKTEEEIMEKWNSLEQVRGQRSLKEGQRRNIP